MKTTVKVTIVSLVIFLSCQGTSQSQIKYPVTKKVDTVNTYFSTKVADPYRWLEDDRSAETGAWVKEQNKVTEDYMSKITYRPQIKQRLKELWTFEKYSAPFKKGNKYFYFKHDGVQNHSVMYVQDNVSDSASVLLDMNKESADGTTSLSTFGVSKDAKYLAYGTSSAGSDWVSIYVMDIKTKAKLKDELKWVKFSDISWSGNGFYYSRYATPAAGKEFSGKNEFHKVYYHTLGAAQATDKLIYEDKTKPQRNFSASVTDDGKYLVISGSESTSGNSLLVKDLSNPAATFVSVVSDFEKDYQVIDSYGNLLLVLTNMNAPHYQAVFINPDKPSPADWSVVIPASNEVLQSVQAANGKLIAKTLKDVSSRLYVYNLSGKMENEIKLPGLGTVESVSSNRNDSLMFFNYATYISPSAVYAYNFREKKVDEFRKPKIDFNADNFETKQVFYKSEDGTDIPMFITYKKGIQLDGKNPTFLFGYGGFNVSYTPEFRVDRAIFLENGGIYAVANIRGGGEYGESWHKAGTLEHKQNVFDDFYYAAEYLKTEGYTSTEKLAIHGRSNGGLLIGACITQHPDMCKVAIPTVGVLDMLRYHKFTIGWAWATDYGTSEQNEKSFRNLLRYSPVHNVKPASYPAVLVTTGDHDDRVVPAHSFKFIANLQEKQNGSNPTLIRIDVNAGHGSGKPIAKQIEEFADMWSFVFYNLGIETNYLTLKD